MKHILILILLTVFSFSGCVKKAIYLQSGPETHGSIDVNVLTGGVSIELDGSYVYCSVPLETSVEGRSFTEGFEKFCQIEIDQLMAVNMTDEEAKNLVDRFKSELLKRMNNAMENR